MKPEFYIWRTPEDLEQSWHPEYYMPKFVALDFKIASHPTRYQELGEIVDVVHRKKIEKNEQDRVDWAAGNYGISAVGEDGIKGEILELFGKEQFVIPMPNEAVVVGTLKLAGGSAGLNAYYWNEDLYSGYGVANPTSSVALTPKTKGSIAWLVNELKSEYVGTQIERLAIGKVVSSSIRLAELLKIKIHVPVEQERDEINKRIIENTRKNILVQYVDERIAIDKQELPTFFIAGATFEERKTQFEHYLLDLPGVNRDSLFFIESSTPDKISDLFMVRPLGKFNAPRILKITPLADDDVNADWREWYGDNKQESNYRVFNSLHSSHSLPSYLIAKMINFVGQQKELKILEKGVEPPLLKNAIIPNYDFYKNIIEPSLAKDNLDESDIDLNLVLGWFQIQYANAVSQKTDVDEGGIVEFVANRLGLPRSENETLNELLKRELDDRSDKIIKQSIFAIHGMYKPTLAIKLFRDDEVAGVYIISDESWALRKSDEIYTKLRVLGNRLLEVLGQSSKILDRAARNESLRRLSDVMHKINGPLMRINRVIEDVNEFVKLNPEISSMLLPTYEKAERRAEMRQAPLEDFTFESRFGELIKAARIIGDLSYKIKQLKLVQGELSFEKVNLHAVILKSVDSAQNQLADLLLKYSPCMEKVICNINEDTISGAIDEILNNSCREIKENNISSPQISVCLNIENHNAKITISDNALPVSEKLISHPFDEGSTSYGSSGRGSGLGLTIVQETFHKHGGKCTLKENFDNENNRTEGVTFEALIPLSMD